MSAHRILGGYVGILGPKNTDTEKALGGVTGWASNGMQKQLQQKMRLSGSHEKLSKRPAAILKWLYKAILKWFAVGFSLVQICDSAIWQDPTGKTLKDADQR